MLQSNILQGGELAGDVFADRKVCVTGRLATMSHAELAALVRTYGGKFLSYPSRGSLLLVMGDHGWPTEDDGSPTKILRRARELQAYGYPIEFLSEDEFLMQLGLAEHGPIRELFTIGDLSRVLDVSAARIRRWVRDGLIAPTDCRHHLAYFDFHQAGFAKRLGELLEAGVSLTAIRRGIDQIRRIAARNAISGEQHLSDYACSAQLDSRPLPPVTIEDDGRILARLSDKLVDNYGQRYLEFGCDEAATTPMPDLTCCVFPEADALFDAALVLEDNERFDEAAAAYERALDLEPDDPTLLFNLGNVLYKAGRCEDSVARYRAASDQDPQYAEAWNNLGIACGDLRRWDEARDALRVAVKLVPTYADAHFNLARVLEQLGHLREAAYHRRAHRQHSAADRVLAGRKNVLRVFEAEAGAGE